MPAMVTMSPGAHCRVVAPAQCTIMERGMCPVGGWFVLVVVVVVRFMAGGRGG